MRPQPGPISIIAFTIGLAFMVFAAVEVLPSGDIFSGCIFVLLGLIAMAQGWWLIS